jgi:hypothetical protein
MRLQNGESQREVMGSYNNGSLMYDIKKQKDQVQSLMTLWESVKGIFKQQTFKEPTLA